MTALRLILWPVLVAFLLPTAVGALMAGCLMRVFDDDFLRDDGWGFFLSPFSFMWSAFPLKGKAK